MNLSIIGEISLSIAFLLYLIYFFPQLWHNHEQEGTLHLSPWLQLLYIIGYCTDWLYGHAANLQWQYRCVTLVGLACLVYQQWQLKPKNSKEMVPYFLFTGAAVVLITASFLFSLLPIEYLPSSSWVGMISLACFSVAFTPQLIHNYHIKNGAAISHQFILLTVSCATLDFIAAFCLDWPLPSLVAPPVLIALNGLCWLQQRHYRRLPISFRRVKAR